MYIVDLLYIGNSFDKIGLVINRKELTQCRPSLVSLFIDVTARLNEKQNYVTFIILHGFEKRRLSLNDRQKEGGKRRVAEGRWKKKYSKRRVAEGGWQKEGGRRKVEEKG